MLRLTDYESPDLTILKSECTPSQPVSAAPAAVKRKAHPLLPLPPGDGQQLVDTGAQPNYLLEKYRKMPKMYENLGAGGAYSRTRIPFV
jgi:hypothetical protein